MKLWDPNIQFNQFVPHYKNRIWFYLHKYKIITDATFGNLEQDEHGTDHGKDVIKVVRAFLKKNLINTRPGVVTQGHSYGYGPMYFLYDKDYYESKYHDDAYFVAEHDAKQIAKEWMKRFSY